MLPTMRITPRDSATAADDRVTIQAETAAHQGSSECRMSAARVARATDSAAPSASVPRGPRGSIERNSVWKARAISRNIFWPQDSEPISMTTCELAARTTNQTVGLHRLFPVAPAKEAVRKLAA